MRIGHSSSCTNAGRKRLQNEDRFVEQPPIFAIADGMGGAQAGEVAAALAASALTESPADGGGEARVIALIQEANRRVHERASTDAATSGMGTTMTVALVGAEGKVTIGHVGDSRAYLFRDDRLEQLTDDHSLVAELVRRGELSPQEAEIHPQRSVITRALGTDPDVDVDAFSIEAEPGDVYLICSDGLSDMVGAEDIEEIVRRYRDDLKQAAKALIQAANRAGGDDNITAVVFDIVDGEPAAAEPDEVTREQVLADQAPPKEFDEEDTLHPEDAVAPPPPAPNAVDTMVVPAEDIAAPEAAAAETEAEAAPPVHVSFGRRLLALLVIVALAALIVVLVVWGLAR
jgi:PPM family protein phosphatase